MSTGRVLIEAMLSNSAVELTFKQTVKGFVLIFTNVLRKTLNTHAVPAIIGDLQVLFFR